jgi:hypothetical protein
MDHPLAHPLSCCNNFSRGAQGLFWQFHFGARAKKQTDKNKILVVQNEDREFLLKLFTTSACGETEPFDLTSATAIKAIFKGSLSNVEITLLANEIVISGSPLLGKLLLKISDTKSALMKVGTNLSFELEIDLGTEKRIVQISGLLTVTARL